MMSTILRTFFYISTLFIFLSLVTGFCFANTSHVKSCPDSALTADVVAIDHPMVFNRLGAQNVNWMMYALRHDVIDIKAERVLGYTPDGEKLFREAARKHLSRGIALRPDLRPRPLVLRVAEGDYLKVRFTNLLHVKPVSSPRHPHDPFPNQANPFKYPDPLSGIDHPVEHAPVNLNPSLSSSDLQEIYRIHDQVASRTAGFHPQGLELVHDIDNDSSYVGKNRSSISPSPGEKEHGSLVKPGESREYCFYAAKEGAYLISNDGAVFGGDGTSGNSGVGLFGAVTVQPRKARFYRAQVTEEEMRLVTIRATPTGQPVINYEKTYDDDCPDGIWCREGKAGLPILNMLQGNRIIHSDINAIVVGSEPYGRFLKETYPLESRGKQNPALPNRLEPFREFVSIFHDENAATQAFPYFFEHPELGHTLHGVRDAFMINYGSGGIGSEIIANRLKAGPMQDCLDCAFEEFFLSSFAVGDPAMLVDKPANLVLSQCQPEFIQMVPDPNDPTGKKEILDPKYATQRDKYCTQSKYPLNDPRDQRAKKVYYPHDPANVHHSYIGDFVKFRNLHSGKEQHIFHLHNHQWLFNANDDNSNYLDAQALGPGSGYTYEITYGGSGNRNKTVGDAIFHCHFYPHFAQGMWYMWRNHDVFEAGTRLKVSDEGKDGVHQNTFGLMDGTPAADARALPDGEIVAGTPIPAIVPLPGKGMPLMPAEVAVRPRFGLDKNVYGSVAEVLRPARQGNENPGYPFWVAGVAGKPSDPISVGSRPTTPPLDMSAIPNVVEGHNGGLPRHTLAGYSAGGVTHEKLTRLTAEKHIKKAKPVYYPEEGTQLEKIAMAFHAVREHETHMISMDGMESEAKFVTNGAPPVPGAPYNDPCIGDDTDQENNKANLLKTGGDGRFFGGTEGGYIKATDALPGGIEFGGDKPRIYKGANLQLDVVFNKLGYHYPQQRILTLWEDVGPLLSKKHAPEPLVIRMNTFDCAMYAHTNLVPKDFYADDFQITTPTDVIGQHIHLPKWDLTSADGSANGWNYEDGTFSPGMVRERITAINKWNAEHDSGQATLVPTAHPYFNGTSLSSHQKKESFCAKKWEEAGGDAEEFAHKWGTPGKCDWFGARTTLQRWFSDPLVNTGGIHRGLGITFTHDHLGPSTHQQLGLYATMLTEPPGSLWRHNETGKLLYDTNSRMDGGPTSWQAVITGKELQPNAQPKPMPIDIDGDKYDDSHREFFLQFGDFQHAYQKDAFYGVTKKGIPWPYPGGKEAKPDTESFRQAINPSVRKPARSLTDIIAFEPDCPGGNKEEKTLPGAVYDKTDRPPRPCPEAIAADDVGMMVVNYRNEPIGARVFDRESIGHDGIRGTQATGFAGDLTFAMQTRTDRAISELNTERGNTPYPNNLTFGVLKGDPFTPILRAYSGDLVRIKVQAGSHEHEHNGSINSLKWMQGGSGFGQAPHSGWRNAQNVGLSEQFTFTARITDFDYGTHLHDRLYAIDTSQDGLWNGVWGVLRSATRRDPLQDHLIPLPRNPLPTVLAHGEGLGHDNGCPKGSLVRRYEVSAVLANRALSKPPDVNVPPAAPDSQLDPNGGTLVYNPRLTEVSIEMWNEKMRKYEIVKFGTGPLHDPTAILFVRTGDLDEKGKIMDGRPVEPVVLRAAAGECIQVVLHNHLPLYRNEMPDLEGHTSVLGVIRRDKGSPGSKMTSFNNNMIRPSNRIGLHPQLVHYNVQDYDANNVGVNKYSTIPPGSTKIYHWYAGMVETAPSAFECPHYDGDERSQYRRMNVFSANPDLRPLTELMTSVAFRNIVFSTLDPDGNIQRRLNRDGAKRFTGALAGAASNLLKTARASNCLEDTTTLLGTPTERSENSAQLAKAAGVREGDEAPLLNSNAYYQVDVGIGDFRGNREDRDSNQNTLHQRLQCSKKMLEPVSAELKLLTQDLNRKFPKGLQAEMQGDLQHDQQPTGKGQKGPSGRDRNISPDSLSPLLNQSLVRFGAERIARSFAYDVEGQDAGKSAYEWRRSTYPEVNPETTGLVALGAICRYVGIELGGSNLTPPDRIKQGQKAAIGALIIEPEKARWSEVHDDEAIDRQHPGADQTHRRKTRATATVAYPVGEEASSVRTFRDFALVHQKALNLRYSNGSPIANLAAEKEKANEHQARTAPEDAHDSGHMAVNYGAEPMWFRFGLAPDAPFGGEGFGGAASAWQAFSNNCCENRTTQTGGTVISADPKVGEPYVPIMTVRAGQEMRIRTLLPTGSGRASAVELHGHYWLRDPYLAERSARGYPMGSRSADWRTPSICIGENALGMSLGGQESVTPMAHFDMVFPQAGGKHRIPGDYLWRDHGGFGVTSGLWSIVRVEKSRALPSGEWHDSCN
jgi:hypothetical protein